MGLNVCRLGVFALACDTIAVGDCDTFSPSPKPPDETPCLARVLYDNSFGDRYNDGLDGKRLEHADNITKHRAQVRSNNLTRLGDSR